MSQRFNSKLVALLMLACAALVGCGAGDPGAPPPPVGSAPPAAGPDVPPTVTIASNVSAAVATGPVTFTFAFSEDVGVSFEASDITVTGGTASGFNRLSGRQATIVVTPTANATGTITVSVAAGSFVDLTLNANTAAASAQKPFDTVVPPTPGNTGTCIAPNCIDFADAAITFGPFENQGGGTVGIDNDPVNASNKVARFVKKPGDGDFFGTTIGGFAGPVTLTANNKTVTLRVLSPRVGTNYLLKFEGGTGGPAATEKDVASTVAGAWETLTFVMPDAGTFTTVVLFPNGRSAVQADTTMYVDELKFPAPAVNACSAPNCVDFSAPGIGFGPFENQGGGTVAIGNDPTNAANKVVQFVKKPGDGAFFGTTITGLGVSPVLTANNKTVTMRVYSPEAGTNFLLKFEGGTGGPATTEKDAATTTANAWETLTFDMPDVGTFSTIVVFPNGRSTVGADKTMYVDDLRFPATAGGGGGGGGTFAGGIFASDYSGDLGNNTAKSDKNGSVGFFLDQRLFDTKVFDAGGVSGSTVNPGGVPNFFYGVGKPANPVITDGFFGGFVNAPGDGTADASSFAKIKLKFWGDAESWEQTNFTAQVDVIVQGPTNPACTNPSGRPEIKRTVPAQKIGAGSEYIIPKTEFTMSFNCGGAFTVDSVWSAVGAVVVLLAGTNLQYVNSVPSTPIAFPTFLNIGPISFIN